MNIKHETPFGEFLRAATKLMEETQYPVVSLTIPMGEDEYGVFYLSLDRKVTKAELEFEEAERTAPNNVMETIN